MQNNKFKFTITVNTYPNKTRDGDLVKCLDSIFNQTYDDFEVIVIENYSNLNEIANLLKRYFSYKDRIKVINNPIKNLPTLFNLGWKYSNSDYLAYIADDVEIESDWLEIINQELDSSKDIGIVTGPIISTCFPAGEMHRLYLLSQNNVVGKVFSWPYLHFAMEDRVLEPGVLFESGAYSIGAGLEESKGYKRQEIDLATTSSMGIKRKVLDKVGGFNTDFNFNHADGDLFIRAKKAGYKIIFNSNVVSHHNVRLGLSRNAYYIGLDTGIFYKKHVRPKSFKGVVGVVLNLLVFKFYWIYSAIRNRDIKQLKGISGFISGYFKKESKK
ncbi:MAG: glycosyltransferase [Patescibacteria group bacterium]